jgi:dipeptidyl aminopeptidase/acylaminoacyl peptidase
MTYGVLGGPPDGENILYQMSDTKNLLNTHSPKTLLIHGSHDSMTPIEADYLLYNKMKALGCDVTFLELPFVDHAFDSLVNEHSFVVDKAFEEAMKWILVNFD